MHSSNAAQLCSILFVDDDAFILKALIRTLRPHFHRIHTALSGEEALAVLATHPIDVIVSDSLTPPISGIELIRRAQKFHPAIGTIVLSGKTELSDILQAKNEGILHAFIPKPWDNQELMRVIRQVFEAALTSSRDL